MNSIERLMEKAGKITDDKFKHHFSMYKKISSKEAVRNFAADIVNILNYYNENKEERIPAFINAIWEYEEDGFTIKKAFVLDNDDNVIYEMDLSNIMDIWNNFAASKAEKKQLDENYFVLRDLCLKRILELAAKAGEDLGRSNEFKRIRDRIEEYEYFGGVQKSLVIELGEVDGDISGIIFSWEEIISEDAPVETDAEDLLNEGIEYYKNNDVENAVKCYEEAVVIFEEIMEDNEEFNKDEIFAACLMNLGNCYAFDLSNSKESVKNYEKCIKIAEKLFEKDALEDVVMLASVYVNAGSEYLLMKEYEKSGYMISKGEKILKTFEEPEGEVRDILLYALIKEGEIYSTLGKYEKSIEKYKEASELNNGADLETEAELFLRIGKNYIENKNMDEAKKNIMRAKEIFENENIKDESYKEAVEIFKSLI